MIITETVEINGKNFIHNYSDANKQIRKIGTEEIYIEAYDPVDFSDRKYEETEIDIPEEPDIQDK